MNRKELYDRVFTEYPGSVGYGPAVIALAVAVAVIAALGLGTYTVGKSVIANTFGIETTGS